MKEYGKAAVRAGVRAAGRHPAIRRILEEEIGRTALKRMRLDDPVFYRSRYWEEVDAIYSLCRRQLEADRYWRYGPARVHETVFETYTALRPFIDVRGKVILDMGCGRHHPYATSAVLYLNGAESLIALDRHDFDRRRSAEALYDLIQNCICFPKSWNWGQLDDYMERVRRFDLEALARGQFDDAISSAPVTHMLGDFLDETLLASESVDALVSWDVLEHVTDFGETANRMFAVMRPGGVAYHCIDLADHRVYWNPRIHKWAFLAEENDFSDSGCSNRLRSCEIRPFLEQAGFEILQWEVRSEQMPEGFREHLIDRFKRMSDEDLNAVGIECVLKKP